MVVYNLVAGWCLKVTSIKSIMSSHIISYLYSAVFGRMLCLWVARPLPHILCGGSSFPTTFGCFATRLDARRVLLATNEGWVPIALEDDRFQIWNEKNVWNYCGWFRNPAITSWYGKKISLFTGFFVHVGWCRISEPSTVWHHLGFLTMLFWLCNMLRVAKTMKWVRVT